MNNRRFHRHVLLPGGTITTLVGPDDLPALLSIMESLGVNAASEDAAAIGTPLLEVSAADGEGGEGDKGVDRLRKGLEDIFNLL